MIDLSARQEPGLAHIGYVVASVEKAMKRWTAQGYETWIEPTSDPIQGVVVALLSDGTVPVELVSPIDAETPSPVEARLRRGGGLDHLCYYVDDVAAALEAEVEEAASMIVCEPVYAVAFERTIGFVQRKTGLVVEYMSCERSEQ